MAKDAKNVSDIYCKFFETSEDVPYPRDLNSEKKCLMIFDDLQLKKQNKSETYYIRGGIATLIAFILHISNYLDKLSEKMQTSYAYFLRF